MILLCDIFLNSNDNIVFKESTCKHFSFFPTLFSRVATKLNSAIGLMMAGGGRQQLVSGHSWQKGLKIR